MNRLACVAVILAACSSPTGALCPTANAPTYASFGQTFFSNYCTDCHSANATDRHDAPSDLNFDTEADIKKHLDEIDVQSAAGPAAINTNMPVMSMKVATMPSQMEREMLGQFLACENN